MGKICDNCHHENNDNAIFCASCGKKLSEDQFGQTIAKLKKGSNTMKTVLICVVIVLVILTLYFIITRNWIALLLIFLFGIPTIITFLKDMLLNKMSDKVFEKIHDKIRNK